MIVKLVKANYILHVEADSVLQQQTESGCIDLEICRGGATVKRVLIGETSADSALIVGQVIKTEPQKPATDGTIRAVVADFYRAYIMEHGKTVDTIRGATIYTPPPTVSISTGTGKTYASIDGCTPTRIK